MQIDEACKLLGIDASTPEMWRQELLALLHAQIEAKVNSAQNPQTHAKYSGALAKLEEASALIKQAAESGGLPDLTGDVSPEEGEPKKQRFWDTLADPTKTIELIVRAAGGEDITSLTRTAALEEPQRSQDQLGNAEDAIEILEVVAGEGVDLSATDGAEGGAAAEAEEAEAGDELEVEEGEQDEDGDEQEEDEEEEEFKVIGDEEEEEDEEEQEGPVVFTIERKTKFDPVKKFFGAISQMLSSAKLSLVEASDRTTERLTKIVGGVVGGIVGGIAGNKALRIITLTIIMLALLGAALYGWQMHDVESRQKAIELTEYAQQLEEVNALNKAADFYQQALDAKSGWQDAVDGLYRVKLRLAQELRSQLSSAELAESAENWEKALGHFKKAASLDPEDLAIEEAILRLESLIATLRGTLVVRTQPDGASVSIGTGRGKTTPASYENLKLGEYTVSITKKGYDPLKRKIQLLKGMNTLGPLPLTRIKGALNINTKPQGGSYVLSQVRSEATSDLVFKPRQGQAPNLEADLPTGEYLIKINKLGWLDEEYSVRVSNTSERNIQIPFTKLDDQLDLSEPGVRDQILEQAINVNELRIHGEQRQEPVYSGPDGKHYTGRVKELYDNGTAAALFSVNDGKKQGLMFRWHDNGAKFWEMSYQEGQKHGLFTHWDENGKKLSETNYVEGQMDGLCSHWNEEGQNLSKTNYKENHKHGLETLWRPNGEKQSEINYAEGKKFGLATEYYMDGKKSREANYEDDVLHGTSAAWNQYGQQKYEINYQHGKRHGVSTEWHENGNKAYESHWHEGDPHGPYISWDQNGEKRSEIMYKNGSVVR